MRALLQLVELAVDRDIVAEQPQERALQVGDEAVDLKNGRLERLAPAESEQLIGQSRGPAGGGTNFR